MKAGVIVTVAPTLTSPGFRLTPRQQRMRRPGARGLLEHVEGRRCTVRHDPDGKPGVYSVDELTEVPLPQSLVIDIAALQKVLPDLEPVVEGSGDVRVAHLRSGDLRLAGGRVPIGDEWETLAHRTAAFVRRS